MDVEVQNPVETFTIGETFESFPEFEAKLQEFQRRNLCFFTKYKSEKCNNDAIQYKYIYYKCIQFGNPRPNPNLTGERLMQKTYKTGCMSQLHLSRNKGKLLVTDFVPTHNHPCNETTFNGYPGVRRLSAKAVEEEKDYQKLHAKPTLIRPLLKETKGYNKIILGRDIRNVRTKSVLKLRDGRSEEEMLLAKLEEIKEKDPGAGTVLRINAATKEVEFLLIQTTEMRQNLWKFPEVLLMDITYKINKNSMPLAVIEVMDGDATGQPVAYAFLANETKITVKNMLQCFLEVSGEEIFSQTVCVVIDKDPSERAALAEVLPGKEILICSVHVERNVKSAAKGEPKKKESLQAFHKMLYAETDEEFQSHYLDFKSVSSEKLQAYVNDNWIGLKEKWALKDKVLLNTLRNNTTNRVECENRNLKLVLHVDLPLYEALDKLVNIVLHNKRDDIRYRDHEALTKRVYINKCGDPVVASICNDLTIPAAKLVCEQLKLSTTLLSQSAYNTTEDKCSCPLAQTMRLTCQHVMRLRRNADKPVYQKDSIPQRWHKNFNIRATDTSLPETYDHQDIIQAIPWQRGPKSRPPK